MAFTETGKVVRKFVANSGNFASVTLDIENNGRHAKIQFVSFDCARDFGNLKEGDEVTLKGRVGIQKLTTKAKEDVIVDGYAAWVPQLVVTEVVTTEGSGQVKSAPSVDDSDIPF
jgi:hypothetical protein